MFQPQPIYFDGLSYSSSTQQPHLSNNNIGSRYFSYNNQPPQQQQLRQGGAASGRGPITFDAPTFTNIGAPTGLWGSIGIPPAQPTRSQHQAAQRQHYDTRSEPILKMEQEDYEAQQALAGGYAPKLEGPLVGEKKSSHAITEEYAKADPVYVEKTRRLPQTYSYYRQIQGDGNCGWRAIGFSYFECLISLWSLETVELELARLFSLTNNITSVGIMEEYILEDFRDPMIRLLTDLSSLISSNTSSIAAATELITQRFNDPEQGNSILYFLRCITAGQLLSNPMKYEPFLDQGMSIESEKLTWLAISTEIDYLGLTVLIEALMKPAGFPVEIVVLERSQGSDVNTIRYDQDMNGNTLPSNAPTAYILYKPGHYDILYKGNANQGFINQQVLDAASAAQNVHVNRAAMPTRQLDPSPMPSMAYSGGFDMNIMASIPGMSMNFSGFQPSYTAMSSSFVPSQYGLGTSMSMVMPSSMAASLHSPPIKSHSPPSPMSAASTLASIPSLPQQHQQSRTPPSNFPPQQYPQSALSSHPGTRNNSIATDSSLLSPLSSTATLSTLSTPTLPLSLSLTTLGINSHDQFRQSRYVFQRPLPSSSAAVGGGSGWGAGGGGAGGVGGGKEVQEMQTRQFRESHHNEAHYDNKNFQPYMWSPGDEQGGGEGEGEGGGAGVERGRKGSKGGKRKVS